MNYGFAFCYNYILRQLVPIISYCVDIFLIICY